MGWNVFPAITIKKAQNNRRTSKKYKQEDITSYYVLGSDFQKSKSEIFLKKFEESLILQIF